MTSNNRSTSATVRAIGPTCPIRCSALGGKAATRPAVALNPTRPQNAAGMRTDPAPSVPNAALPIPHASDAAAPPLDPPGVRLRSNGFRVAP